MKISKLRRYKNQLTIILNHIAKDKITASENFYTDLNEAIKEIPNFPFKYRNYTIRGDWFCERSERKLSPRIVIARPLLNCNTVIFIQPKNKECNMSSFECFSTA